MEYLTSRDFERYDAIKDDPEFQLWILGINPSTKRVIKIGGETHRKVGEDHGWLSNVSRLPRNMESSESVKEYAKVAMIEDREAYLAEATRVRKARYEASIVEQQRRAIEFEEHMVRWRKTAIVDNGIHIEGGCGGKVSIDKITEVEGSVRCFMIEPDTYYYDIACEKCKKVIAKRMKSDRWSGDYPISPRQMMNERTRSYDRARGIPTYRSWNPK